MPANVSIAFAIPGDLSCFSPIRDALLTSGVLTATVITGEGRVIAEITLPLGGEPLAGSLRIYEDEGWCSVTIGVDAEQYDAAADTWGRAQARDALIALAAALGESLQLAYALLDEEIDADTSPKDTDAIPLVGITLLPQDSPAMARLRSRPEVQQVQQHGTWTALLRRLDPIPHHPDA